MRSIFVLLILVMIGLNGKGQSVTALPDSVLSQCCLEVTLLNGNLTTVDWVFIQYITRDGTGTKLFVEYAPNFGGIQWETQIRIQDDFDDVLERSKFIVIPFTVGSTDYGINRNWIANIEENTTTGGTWIYGRFGTPTKRKFSAVEDYGTMKNLLLACRPRAIVVAENGLYTEGDTVRMGGFLIEPTTITTEGYNWQMKDTLSSVEFGLDYSTPETGDTTVYWARRHGSLRQMVQLGRRYYYNSMRDTTGGLYSDLTHSWNAGDPFLQYQVFNPSAPTTGTAWFKIQKDNSFLNLSNDATNPYYSLGWTVTNTTASLGASESGSGDPGNGVVMGAYGFGTTEFLFLKTKRVDAGTATNGQFLQLIDNSSGEVDFATIDPVDSSLYATRYWTTSNFFPLQGGTLTGTGGAGFVGFPSQVSAPGTPASGLNVYAQGSSFNWKGTDGYERQFASTLTGGRTYTLPNVSGTFALGTGTANLVPLWTATNTLGNSNIQDNNTVVSILNNKPFALGQWTTAGRPTGINGYVGFNTIFNWPEFYSSSTWVFPLQAHGAPTLAGNAIAYASPSTGRIKGSNIFQYNEANQQIGIYGVGFAGNYIEIYRSNSSSKPQLLFFTTANGAGTLQFGSNSGNTVWDFSNNVNVAGFISAGTKLNGNSVSVGNNSYPISNGSMTIIPAVGNPGFINFTEPGVNYMGNFGVYQTSGDLIWETVPAQANQFGTGTQRFRINRSSGNFGIGTGSTINYSLEQLNKTDAFGIARGTVAQRPTVSSSTTPIRYNTDSIMLEYGESAGTWRQLASRLYVRTVTNNNAWLGTRLAAGDVTINTPYTSVLKIKQDTGFWSLRRGVMFMGSPDKDTTGNDRTPSIFIMPNEADSTAAYMRASNSVWIGSRLDANQFPPEGSVTIGYLNKNNSTFGSYFSNVVGFLNEARGTINTNIYGQGCLVTQNDAQAYGFNVDLTGFSTIGIGRNINISGAYSAGIGRDITSTISNRYIYGIGISDVITHQLNGSFIVGRDSSLKFNQITKTLQLSSYGTGTKEATDLSKTQSNYIAGFATDGTVLDLERKRDTTVYIVDTDLDWSAAITTAQIGSRYNRVIFLMTTTAAAGSNSDLTLHTPDVNLMQVEYLIRSTDEAGGFTNTIQFGTNNAVASDNALASSYTPSPGQGVGIRAGLRSGVYKYFYY